ncbi:hypothetical protein RGUI_4046 [Rhodovulum sp. P5]|uniref:DUF6455 family protein n=1 Tax=Rhodovulum sp. P5 TaxID=1564506 RepID=UPI0009C1D238|nr:DUF6455 family protein [Rhodovulum sp. P5]ARE42187.1 hypothetical protein RGUI_4046 [Rhodovulum sp. P5]
MEDHGNLSMHFWLAQGMARTIGVNVNQALNEGQIGRGEFSELIARCCHCDRSDTCMTWMGQQVSGAEALPGWCALKDRFEALRELA